MRRWENALLPLLTVLAVLCLALLPPRLSQTRDRGLLGSVHAEALGEDSNFPSRPPPMSGRIWLAAQGNDWPDALAEVHQELVGEELEQAGIAALAEVRALKDLGFLPEDLPEEDAVIYGVRGYLRDRTDLASANFLEMQLAWEKTDRYLSLLLDGESGKTLTLTYVSYQNRKQDWDMESLGRAFLERLLPDGGWELESMDEQDKYYADFRLPESRAMYLFLLEGGALRVILQVDWSAVEPDSEAQIKNLQAYGITVDGYSGDSP